MKTNPRRGRAAFSLVELMTVIAIIVLLSGLVIASMGFVQDLRDRKKAQLQVQLLSKAVEDYKLDNGSYPATANLAITGSKVTLGSGNSKILFKALYNDGANDTTGVKKVYISELNPANNRQGWTTGSSAATSFPDDTNITDPWGNEYIYRTAINSSAQPNASTRNPDFDLWSCGKDGKTSDTTGDPVTKDDIWNK